MTEAWTTRGTDTGHCTNCGSKVTLQFRRVFGSQKDIAHACNECTTYSNLQDGAAAFGGEGDE